MGSCESAEVRRQKDAHERVWDTPYSHSQIEYVLIAEIDKHADSVKPA